MEISILLIGLLGLLVGSFLNVCIYRIPRKESVIFPPSYCTSCGKRLRSLDLIPLLSYLFFKGKCRYCGEEISPQYPLIELLNGVVYLLLFLHFGYFLDFVFYGVLSSILIIVSGIDYEHQIIPDGLVLIGLLIGVLYKLIGLLSLNLPVYLLSSVVGFFIGGGILLIIAIASQGGMGGGDIKLMAMLGFWIGWQLTLVTLFISFISGAILSIFLLVLKIKGRKEMIPFGPFIVFAFFIVLIFGERILYWYSNFFKTRMSFI